MNIKGGAAAVIFSVSALSCHGASADTPDFYSGLQNIPARVRVFKYRGSPKRTLGLFIVLPQLYIFSRGGQLIASHVGEIDHLTEVVDHELTANSPIHSGEPLDHWMHKITPVKEPAAAPDTGDAQVTVLEYWAPWCEYCFQERDSLLALFEQRRDLTVNWIMVDTDAD